MRSLKDLYVKFCGAGDRNAKYWFFGIEPGGSCESVKDNFNKNDEELLEWLHNIDETPKAFYKRFILLIKSLSNKGEVSIKEEWFESEKIKLKPGDNCCFKSDIFMLNFSNKDKEGFTKDAECYKNHFEDFKFSNRYEYEEYLKNSMNERYENNFKEFLNRSQKKVVFLFTVNDKYFSYLKKLLNIENETPKKTFIKVKYIGKRESTVTFYNYSNLTLVTTPHLSRWSGLNHEADKIVAELKKYLA